jgi:hypothetical protein
MTDKELWEKRCIPALNEMYLMSDTVFGKSEFPSDFEYTFENIMKYSPKMEDGRCEFPLYAFFSDKEKNEEIMKKATARLRSWYVFPYRSEIIYDDEQIAEMKEKIKKLSEDKEKNSFEIALLEEKIIYNDIYKERHQLWLEYKAKYDEIEQSFQNKEIDRKAYNQKKMDLYKEYKCTKRGEGERVRWTVFNYEPNNNEEIFNSLKKAYNGEDYDWNNKDFIDTTVKSIREFVNNVKTNIITVTKYE